MEMKLPSPEQANVEYLIDLVADVLEENKQLKSKIIQLEEQFNKNEILDKTNFTVAEVAKILRTGPNVIYNLIFDERIRAMKLPVVSVPDFELERFRREVWKSQEDLSKYADKKYREKYGKKKELSVVNISKKAILNV